MRGYLHLPAAALAATTSTGVVEWDRRVDARPNGNFIGGLLIDRLAGSDSPIIHMLVWYSTVNRTVTLGGPRQGSSSHDTSYPCPFLYLAQLCAVPCLDERGFHFSCAILFLSRPHIPNF